MIYKIITWRWFLKNAKDCSHRKFDKLKDAPEPEKKSAKVRMPVEYFTMSRCKKCGKKVWEASDYKYGAFIMTRHVCKKKRITKRKKNENNNH